MTMPKHNKMTARQKLFVEEYLVDLNATQAAVRAGYSVRSAASIGDENLRKPEIQKMMTESIAARRSRTEITQDSVLFELQRGLSMAMGDQPQHILINSGADSRTIYAHKTELSSASKILDMLGKHIGLFNQAELSGLTVNYQVNYGPPKQPKTPLLNKTNN